MAGNNSYGNAKSRSAAEGSIVRDGSGKKYKKCCGK